MDVKDLLARAKLVLEHADRMGCKRYLTPRDIVDGLPNLNLAFVAHIFQKRCVPLANFSSAHFDYACIFSKKFG